MLAPLLAACGQSPAAASGPRAAICARGAHPPRAPGPAPDAHDLLAPPLYGFWGLNGHSDAAGLADMQRRFGTTVFQVASSSVDDTLHALLPTVHDAGMKITMRLSPDHGPYTTWTGDFDVDAWKASLAPWVDSGLQPWIDNGTLVGHMLLDDIANFTGRDPSAADLDEMARCSKEVFPGLMTYVRQKATDMPVPRSGRYVHLDAIVNQYEVIEGPVAAYATHEAAAAKKLDLGVINGLNIADGGDGSSKKPGYRPGRWAMSAAEITSYGGVLAAVPTCGMFLNWEYDGLEHWDDGSIGAPYFDQPELQGALQGLATVVAAHPHVSLLRP